MSIGNLQVGQPGVMTAGQSLQIKSGQGALLGFLASVAGTLNAYDNAAANTTSPLITSLPVAAGWNPIPLAFSVGLYITLTTAAGTVVYA